MAATGHWLDHLMLRQSRRQALKGLLGLAAVATLPVRARVPSREPADANLCQKGCLYFYANTNYEAEIASCANSSDLSGFAKDAATLYSLANVSFLASMLAYPLIAANSWIGGKHDGTVCRDQALTSAKAHSWDCLQPGCPNFDPKAKGGPCENCKASCCADPGVLDGFSCCNICSSSGGCCYSVTGNC